MSEYHKIEYSCGCKYEGHFPQSHCPGGCNSTLITDVVIENLTELAQSNGNASYKADLEKGDNAILIVGETYYTGWIEMRLDYDSAKGNVEQLYFCREAYFPISLKKISEYGKLAKAFGQWISIADDLPEVVEFPKTGREVILLIDNEVSGGWQLNKKDNELFWYREEDCWIKVTDDIKWMPLPKP